MHHTHDGHGRGETCHNFAQYRDDGTVTPCEWGPSNSKCAAKYADEFRYGCPPAPPAAPTVDIKVSNDYYDAPYFTFDPPLMPFARGTSYRFIDDGVTDFHMFRIGAARPPSGVGHVHPMSALMNISTDVTEDYITMDCGSNTQCQECSCLDSSGGDSITVHIPADFVVGSVRIFYECIVHAHRCGHTSICRAWISSPLGEPSAVAAVTLPTAGSFHQR